MSSHRPNPRRNLLGLEHLEDRTVPSHFRYTTISWSPDAGTSATFDISQAFRRSSFSGTGPDGLPVVGDTVINDTFNFGDGTSAPVNLVVTSINTMEDSLNGSARLSHTYTGGGNFLAFLESCCRISTLQNNRDGDYHAETRVTIGGAPANPFPGNASPVSGMSPIFQVSDDQVVNFQVPAFDPNGDTLTYRLATGIEAAGSFGGASYTQPPGFTVSSTGQVTWDIRNTGGLATNPGDLWTAQIIVEDRQGGPSGPVKSTIPVDFILQIAVEGSVSAQPVVTVNPPGPFRPVTGVPIVFDVTAMDPDGTIVSLQALNPPPGMTFTPFGSPGATKTITATFTPTSAQSSQTFVIIFQATDNTGVTGQGAVTISPAAVTTLTAVNDHYTVPAGQSLTVAAPGVLANDIQPQPPQGPLSAILETPPAANDGTLIFNSDGSFTFTPGAGFGAQTTFTYKITDGVTTTAVATVTLLNGAVQVSHLTAVGAGAGGGPRVKVFNADGSTRFDFFAFEPTFFGGVRVAVADVTGDAVDDIVVGAGPTGGPRISVFDGMTGNRIADFFSMNADFRGGVHVAAGDVNGDGRAEIIAGASSTADTPGGPRVVVFDAQSFTMLASFFAYAPSFQGGVRVASGDLDGDGRAEIVTAAGPSGGPDVRVFTGEGVQTSAFFAFDSSYRGGAFVAVMPGPAGASRIFVAPDSFPNVAGSTLGNQFGSLPNSLGAASGLTPSLPALARIPQLFVFEPGESTPHEVLDVLSPTFLGGARLGTGMLGSSVGVFVGAGADGGGRLQFYEYQAGHMAASPTLDFTVFEPSFLGSIYVDGGTDPLIPGFENHE